MKIPPEVYSELSPNPVWPTQDMLVAEGFCPLGLTRLNECGECACNHKWAVEGVGRRVIALWHITGLGRINTHFRVNELKEEATRNL